MQAASCFNIKLLTVAHNLRTHIGQSNGRSIKYQEHHMFTQLGVLHEQGQDDP